MNPSMRRRSHARSNDAGAAPRKPRLQRLREVLPLAWTLVRPRLPSLGLGLLLILISRAAGLVLPGAARIFIDEVVAGAQHDRMRFVVVSVLAAALVQSTCSYFLFLSLIHI